MGWITNYYWKNAKDVQDHLTHTITGLGLKIEATSVNGAQFYVAVYSPVTDEISIMLYLIRGNSGEWSYKSIPASAYPYYYACPERILKLSTAKDKNTLEWIKTCREKRAHANKMRKLFASLKHGDVVRLYNNDKIGYTDFTFECMHKGQPCFTREGENKIFRYPKRITEQWEFYEVL